MPRTRSVRAARLRGSMQAPQGGRHGFRRGRNLPASARRHDGQTVSVCALFTSLRHHGCSAFWRPAVRPFASGVCVYVCVAL